VTQCTFCNHPEREEIERKIASRELTMSAAADRLSCNKSSVSRHMRNCFPKKVAEWVKPEAGSCYIRSVCEPFDIEMELDLKKAENWLTHFGLYPYTQIHASGHLNYDEIRDAVSTQFFNTSKTASRDRRDNTQAPAAH
jgi:hypothetical protein